MQFPPQTTICNCQGPVTAPRPRLPHRQRFESKALGVGLLALGLLMSPHAQGQRFEAHEVLLPPEVAGHVEENICGFGT